MGDTRISSGERFFGIWIVIVLLSLSNAASSQTLVNDYATQPDLWRPARTSEARVDARGDLNLHIPVMTIPGRNGLDFEVKFSYRSGVTTKQQSSWLGIGWGFDPGSITRDVRLMLQNGQAYNVDYDDAPDVQPDLYYVTLPGDRFTLTRHNIGVGSTTTPPPGVQSFEFARTAWRPWKVAVETSYIDNGSTGNVSCLCTQVLSPDDPAGSPRDDITSWVLTDEGGNRYVFGNPLLASFTGRYSNQNLHSIEYHVASWQLIAILSHDYAGTIPYSPDDLNGNSPGSWIKFEYSEPATTSYVDTELTGFTEIRQASYITAIETPTHRAEFVTVPKTTVEESPPKWEGGLSSIYRQLESISLFNTTGESAGTEPVREIVLGQSGSIDGFEGTERLSLDAVAFYGVGGQSVGREIPGYRFTYYPVESGALDNVDQDIDDFGFYNADPYSSINADTLDARAWSLKTVVHPVGYMEEFVYSNDEICYYCASGLPGESLYLTPYREYTHYPDEIAELDRNFTIGSGDNRQGGTRVLEIRRYEMTGGDVYSTTRYEYSGGRVSGVPQSFLEAQYPSVFFKNVNRGRSAVYYNRVKRVNPDATWSETYYTTDLTHTAVEASTTAIFQIDSDRIVVTGNEDILWGRPYMQVANEGESIEREILFDQSLVRLSESLNVNGNEISTYWFREDQKLEETIRRYASGFLTSGDYITETVTTEYHPETAQPVSVSVSRTGLDDRVTDFIPLTDIPLYSWAASRNMLSQLAGVTQSVIDPVTGSQTYYSASATAWGLFNVTVSDETFEVPHPVTEYVWRQNEPTSSAPVFVGHDGTTPSSEWVPVNTVIEYDAFGNPVELTDASGVMTRLTHGLNASRVTEVHKQAGIGGVIAESFSSGSWEDVWDRTEEGVYGVPLFSVGNGRLIIEDAGIQSAGDRDYISAVTSPISGNVLFDIDVTLGASNGRSLYVSLGDAAWSNVPGSSGVAAWLVFDAGKLFVFDRNKWRPASGQYDPGHAYRLTIELDLEAQTATYRANGISVYESQTLVSPVQEITTVAIGIDGESSAPGLWMVDNVRLQSAADLLTVIEYDAVHLRPSAVTDDNATVFRYVYDIHGRLAGEQTFDGRRKSSTTYRQARRSNVDDVLEGVDNVIRTLSYVDDAHQYQVVADADWSTVGGVEFGSVVDNVAAARIGGSSSIWSNINQPAPPGRIVVNADILLGESASGVPHLLSLYGSSQTFAIRYNGTTNKLCISFSNATYAWTWDCWSTIAIDTESWYTLELRNLSNGMAEARFWRRDDPSSVSPSKIIDGFATDWSPRIRIMSKEDQIAVANIYAGRFLETQLALDTFGRKTHAWYDGQPSGTTTVTDYDEMDRQTRRYLPVPAQIDERPASSMVQEYYIAEYGPETVWPFKELEYDEFGRVWRKFPEQVGDTRYFSETQYYGEPYVTSLETDPGPFVNVVANSDENGVVRSILQDALGRTLVEREDVSIPAPDNLPEVVTLSAERETADYTPGADPIIIPTEVDLDDWGYDSFSYVPDLTLLVRFDISLEVENTGQASIALLQNGSTNTIWVFDNTQNPTIYTGYVPMLQGQEYTWEVSAGVSSQQEFAGRSEATLVLTFQENGSYRGMRETQYLYDYNDNVVQVRQPACFENDDICSPSGGPWSNYYLFDTASNLIASSSNIADGDGDGDPTNETGYDDADFRIRNTLAGVARFVEDPATRNSVQQKYLLSDLDAHQRIVESGVYLGKYSFDASNPDAPVAGARSVSGRIDYSGGRVRSAEHDSTVYSYGYDASGRVTEMAVSLPGLSDDKLISYQYDRLGNLVSVQFQPDNPDESFVTWYDYNGAGMIEAVLSGQTTERDDATIDFQYFYDLVGRLSSVVVGEATGEEVNLSYTIQGYLSSINDLDNEESGLFAESIGYDTAAEIATSPSQTVPFYPRHNGSISWIAWRSTGNTAGGAVGGYTFEYDLQDRLIRADYGKRYGINSTWSSSNLYDVGSGSSDAPIRYDRNGNVVTIHRRNENGGGAELAYHYDFPGSGLLTRVTGGLQRELSYDYNGNLVSDDSQLLDLSYDERNQLVSMVTSVADFRYRYDTNMRRIATLGSDARFNIRGKDGNILAVYDGDGVLLQWNIVASNRTIGYVTP